MFISFKKGEIPKAGHLVGLWGAVYSILVLHACSLIIPLLIAPWGVCFPQLDLFPSSVPNQGLPNTLRLLQHRLLIVMC